MLWKAARQGSNTDTTMVISNELPNLRRTSKAYPVRWPMGREGLSELRPLPNVGRTHINFDGTRSDFRRQQDKDVAQKQARQQ